MAGQQHKSGEDVTALMGGSGEDVTALMASHEPPKAPETGVMSNEDWAKLSGGQKMRNVLQWGGKALGGAFFGPQASGMVNNPKTALAGVVLGQPRVVQGLSRITQPVAAAAPAALRHVAADPVSALVGGYAGYQAAGVPGAIAGAFGLPTGVRGLQRLAGGRAGQAADPDAVWEQEAKNLTARDKYLQQQQAQEAATAAEQAKVTARSQRKADASQKATYEQEARNLNTRDKFLADQAATQADDVAVHQRMLDRIAQAKTKQDLAKAQQDWKAIIQHARNLTEAEKATARIASERAAQDRAHELFPNGVERGPASQRITSRTVQDGISTTTSQTAKPTLSPEAKALLEMLQPKIDARGIGAKEGLMEDARRLSRKIILTPAEQQRLAFLNERAATSAREVGMTDAAAGRPYGRQYQGQPTGGLLNKIMRGGSHKK